MRLLTRLAILTAFATMVVASQQGAADADEISEASSTTAKPRHPHGGHKVSGGHPPKLEESGDRKVERPAPAAGSGGGEREETHSDHKESDGEPPDDERSERPAAAHVGSAVRHTKNLFPSMKNQVKGNVKGLGHSGEQDFKTQSQQDSPDGKVRAKAGEIPMDEPQPARPAKETGGKPPDDVKSPVEPESPQIEGPKKGVSKDAKSKLAPDRPKIARPEPAIAEDAAPSKASKAAHPTGQHPQEGIVKGVKPLELVDESRASKAAHPTGQHPQEGVVKGSKPLAPQEGDGPLPARPSKASKAAHSSAKLLEPVLARPSQASKAAHSATKQGKVHPGSPVPAASS